MQRSSYNNSTRLCQTIDAVQYHYEYNTGHIHVVKDGQNEHNTTIRVLTYILKSIQTLFNHLLSRIHNDTAT